MSLDIQSAVDGSIARIALTGELDSSTAPALREVVERVLGEKPALLVLQVEQLSFMASAGLRILIFAKQKQPGLRIYFVRPMPTIVDTLHKTGFYDGVYVTDVEPGIT